MAPTTLIVTNKISIYEFYLKNVTYTGKQEAKTLGRHYFCGDGEVFRLHVHVLVLHMSTCIIKSELNW